MTTVLVIGAGFMGSGIAQVCAQTGYQVHLMDSNQTTLSKAVDSVTWSVGKLSAKGFLQETPETVMSRITKATDLSPAAQADWIVEAAWEREDLKLDIFKQVDTLAPPSAILASNTSSIPITRLAKATSRPDRFLGLHFFGPVPLMPLVEVVKGEETSEETLQKGLDFVRSLGKTPVKVLKDIPMFVMNRIFSAAFSEALNLVAEGICSPEDVDTGMKLGYGWNAGPFEIADNAGLDTFALIFQSLETLGETRLAPGPGRELIDNLLKQGRVGRKIGHGFYQYGKDGRKIPS